jgi:hypothetical protein
MDYSGEINKMLRDREEEIQQREQLDPYEFIGWPGDGSGLDDLADFNANEADDYRDE